MNRAYLILGVTAFCAIISQIQGRTPDMQIYNAALLVVLAVIAAKEDK